VTAASSRTRRSSAPNAVRAALEIAATATVAREQTGIPVHVVTVADVFSGDPGSSPGSAEFAFRLLAEGDSWFTIGGIPSSNLLYEMRLPQSAIVCNIAYPGDTLTHIGDLARNRDLRKLLTDRFGYRWHAILISAGGNDLMDRAPQLLRNPGNGSSDPRDYLVREQLERFVFDVQDGYRSIVGVRDGVTSVNHGVPIVVHGYDYPTPRNAPASFFALPLLGPWLYRAFNDKHIEDAMRVPITDFLVDVLAAAIKVLAAGPSALPHLHFVDTRGTLQRAVAGATGTSGDWLNEIHPSHSGYRKIAAGLTAKVVSLLEPRE
jgi:lysophospholipase L1-like esterase